MILEQGIKIYQPLLEKALDYVNKGWRMSYELKDIVGLEMNTTYIFLHFSGETEAYPIRISVLFIEGQSVII